MGFPEHSAVLIIHLDVERPRKKVECIICERMDTSVSKVLGLVDVDGG